jgi:hypothetical protein
MALNEEMGNMIWGQQPRSNSDVLALGNLCVDVIVPVPSLPPPDMSARRALLQQLNLQPEAQDETCWEVCVSENWAWAAL